MEAEKKKLDATMIISCACTAVAISIGIIFGGLGMFGITIYDCNSNILITVFFVLSGAIWGTLLCRNC